MAGARPMTLPDFPVDPGTLDAIEGALTQDGTTIDRVLELLSGYDGAGEETVRGGLAVTYVAGRLYSREDALLALIREVRALRRRIPRPAPKMRPVTPPGWGERT